MKKTLQLGFGSHPQNIPNVSFNQIKSKLHAKNLLHAIEVVQNFFYGQTDQPKDKATYTGGYKVPVKVNIVKALRRSLKTTTNKAEHKYS